MDKKMGGRRKASDLMAGEKERKSFSTRKGKSFLKKRKLTGSRSLSFRKKSMDIDGCS